MSLSVQVPRDLSKVRARIILGLTKRQLICFGGAALFGVPSFFLLRNTGNNSLACLGMILVMLPLFFMGMYEKDGQTPEKIAMQFIRARFIRPRKRIYQTDNLYAALMRQSQLKKEVRAIVQKKEKKRSPARKRGREFRQRKTSRKQQET